MRLAAHPVGIGRDAVEAHEAPPTVRERSVGTPGTLTVVARKWHADGTTGAVNVLWSALQRSHQGLLGGDDGTRTHDFLLAKQVL
jgi:hypothetical protein